MRITAGLLAVTIGLTTMANGALANVTLDGLEVVGTQDKLHVLLKSHQLIPARVVSQRPHEVVLELSNIDTRSPITTRFSGQSLVSHVSMQALDDTRMRIVLRGDGLPTADIAFKPVQAPTAAELFHYDMPTRAAKPAQPKPSAKAAAKPVLKPNKPVSKPVQAKPAGADDMIADWREGDMPPAVKPKAYATAPQTVATSRPITPIVETLPPEASVDPVTSAEKTDPYEPLISAINGDPAADAPVEQAVAFPAKADSKPDSKPDISPAQQESKKVTEGLNWLQTIAPSLLGGMLMAIGGAGVYWFFRRQTRPANPYAQVDYDRDHYDQAAFDDYWDEEPPAAPQIPRRLKRQASRPEPVLGLSAFNREPEPAYPSSGQYANRQPAGKPSANPQAIRQYQQQSVPSPGQPTRTPQPKAANTARMATERLASMTRDDYDITREEVRRSAGVKQRRVEAFQPPKIDAAPPRQQSARPMANRTGQNRNGVRESLEMMGKNGLPANPEVLDFLKSVADYMDKQPPQKPL